MFAAGEYVFSLVPLMIPASARLFIAFSAHAWFPRSVKRASDEGALLPLSGVSGISGVSGFSGTMGVASLLPATPPPPTAPPPPEDF